MMNREVTKMKKLEKGFTLIELMIVVAIIAILAAVAAPKFADQIKKAKDAKAIAVLGAARSATNIYYADKDGVYPTMGAIKTQIDSGSQRLFVGTETASTGALQVGTNSSGATTVAITIAGSGGATIATPSMTYDEGEVYLGASTETDTKGNYWVEY